MNINQSNKNNSIGNNYSLNHVDNRSINSSSEASNTSTSINSNNTHNTMFSMLDNIRNNNNVFEQELSPNTTMTRLPLKLSLKITPSKNNIPPPHSQNHTQPIQNTPMPQYEQFLKAHKGVSIEDIEDDHYDEELIGLGSQHELVVDEEVVDNDENDNGGDSHPTQTLAPQSTLLTSGSDDNYYQDIVGSTFDFNFSETNGLPKSSFPDYHNYNIGGSSSTTSNANTFNGQIQSSYKRYKSDRTDASSTVFDETDNTDSPTGEAFSSGFGLLNIPELLKINKEYQDHINKCLATIEFEQSRNKELLEKAKRYEKVKLPRHKGIPVNSDGGVDEDFIFHPSGRKKANGDQSNYERYLGNEDVHSIHSVYRVEEKKSGIPFFSFEKQVDGVTQTYYPADNPDSIYIRVTKNNMPLFFKTKKWTKKESTMLAKGIKDKNDQKQKFRIQEENDSRAEFNNKKAIIAADPLDIDQDQIPTINIIQQVCAEGLTRSPLEAYLRWKNRDHPSINKKPFTKEEDKKLLLLAKKYGGHEWVKIATELGTNRTALACIQRYQRSLNSDLMKKDWTREEDKELRGLVEYQIKKNGTRIDWQDVADKLVGRTSHQCLHRWYKTLDPSIRRGRWNEDEDACLLEAVKLCGRGNWIMIKAHVKGRTDVQCRERYCNVLDPLLVKNQFTKEEDARLIQVTKEIGIGKWSEISKVIGGRTDNQCWRRWKQLNKGTPELLEYMSKVGKKKEVCVNNFAGRNKERSSLTVDDMLAVDHQFKQQIANESLTSTNLVESDVNTTNNNTINNNAITQQLPTTEPHFQLPQPTQPAQPTFISFQNNTSGGTIVNNFNVENIMYRSNTTSNNLTSSRPPTPPLSVQYQLHLKGGYTEKHLEDFDYSDDYDEELIDN